MHPPRPKSSPRMLPAMEGARSQRGVSAAAAAPALRSPAASPLLLHQAGPLSRSIAQFEQLVAAEDEEEEEEEEDGVGTPPFDVTPAGGDEDEEEDEQAEVDAEAEEQEEYEEEAAYEDAMQEALHQIGGLDPSLYPFAHGLGALDGGGGDDFGAFPVQHAEEDQMLVAAESEAGTPFTRDEQLAGTGGRGVSASARARSRRASRGDINDAATAAHSSQLQPWPLAQAQPAQPTLSSLRRYSHMELLPAASPSDPASDPLRLSSTGSRPLSADIERKSFAGQHLAQPLQPVAAAGGMQASPVRRTPFHDFGKGPVAPRSSNVGGHGGTSPPAQAPARSPLRRNPVLAPLPALQPSATSASRPGSPGTRESSPRFLAPDSYQHPQQQQQQQQHHQPPSQLVHSKNSFHPPPAGYQQRQAAAARPQYADFPDFPSAHPSGLPGPFSAAPSNPVALLALPTPAGGPPLQPQRMFELPPGYEIRRTVVSVAQPAERARWRPGLQQQQQQPEEAHQRDASVAAAPHLRRAMADVLRRLASEFGLGSMAPSSSSVSSSVVVEKKDGGSGSRGGDDEADEAMEISFGISDGEGEGGEEEEGQASRDRSPPRSKGRKARKDHALVVPASLMTLGDGGATDAAAAAAAAAAAPSSSPLPAPDAAPPAPSSPAAPTGAAPNFASKLAGLSSFIQDAFAEIDEEGGTPRENRTQRLDWSAEAGAPPPAPAAAVMAKEPAAPPSPPSVSSRRRSLSLSPSKRALSPLSHAPKPPPMMLSSIDGPIPEGTGTFAPMFSPNTGAVLVEVSPGAVQPPAHAVAGGAGGGAKQKAWGTMKKGSLPSLSHHPSSSASAAGEDGAPAAAAAAVAAATPVLKESSHSPAASTKPPKRAGSKKTSVSSSVHVVVPTQLSTKDPHHHFPSASPPAVATNHAQGFRGSKATLGPIVVGGGEGGRDGGGKTSRGKKGDAANRESASTPSPGAAAAGMVHVKDMNAMVGAAVSSSAAAAASPLPSPSPGSSPTGSTGKVTGGGGKKKLKKKAGGGKGKKSSSSSASSVRLPPAGITLSKALPAAPIRCLCLSPNGKEVWSAEKDGSIVIREVTSGTVLSRLYQPSILVTTLATVGEGKDGGVIWAGTESGKILRIDPTSRGILTQSDPSVSSLAPTTTSASSASLHGGSSTTTATATGLGSTGIGGRTFTSAISLLLPLRDRVFTASADSMIRSWCPRSGRYLRTYPGHSLPVRAMLPMGQSILWSGSDDRSIRITQVETGQCIQVLLGHTEGVTALVATSQGAVCSAGADGTIRVWKNGSGGSSGGSSAEATQTPQPHPRRSIILGGAAEPDSLPPPPVPSASGGGTASSWHCAQVVPCGVGRIASLLLVSRSMLWSVGQHDRVVVWHLGAGGMVSKKKELEGGHSSFITGAAVVRRTEVKHIWTHSLSTASTAPPSGSPTHAGAGAGAGGENGTTTGLAASPSPTSGGGGDKLCMWTYIAHNPRDLSEALQFARSKNHALLWLLHHTSQRQAQMKSDFGHARQQFQQQVQGLILLLAEGHARELDLTESLHAASVRARELDHSLTQLRLEHSQLRASHGALEARLTEQSELHEEYAENLKRVIADGTKRREGLEGALEAARAEAESTDQRLAEALSARQTLHSRLAETEQSKQSLATELARLVEEHEALKLQSAHSQLVSLEEERLLSELASLRHSVAESESARLAERRRAEELGAENARLESLLAAGAAREKVSLARSDELARGLAALGGALDRCKRSVHEGVTRLLKVLSRENAAKVQGEMSTAASGLAHELAEAQRALRALMQAQLSPEQMWHVGASAHAHVASPQPGAQHEGGSAAAAAASAAAAGMPAPADQ